MQANRNHPVETRPRAHVAPGQPRGPTATFGSVRCCRKTTPAALRRSGHAAITPVAGRRCAPACGRRGRVGPPIARSPLRTNSLIAGEADLALVWRVDADSGGRRLGGLRDALLRDTDGPAAAPRLLATHAIRLGAGQLDRAANPAAPPRAASRRGRAAGAARFDHGPGRVPCPRCAEKGVPAGPAPPWRQGAGCC